MTHTGFILYGYDNQEAVIIKNAVDRILQCDSIMISASKMEKNTIDEILQRGPVNEFEKGEETFMMLLGMEKESVMNVVKFFPKEGVRRPIFCMLTKNNIDWSVEKLVKHLIDEQRTHKNESENSQCE